MSQPTTDPHLDALRAAYPLLTWSRRRGRERTYYHGRTKDYAFPLVLITDHDDRQSADCTLYVPYIGERYGWAHTPVAALESALQLWREDAQKGEAAVAAAFGGGE